MQTKEDFYLESKIEILVTYDEERKHGEIDLLHVSKWGRKRKHQESDKNARIGEKEIKNQLLL